MYKEYTGSQVIWGQNLIMRCMPVSDMGSCQFELPSIIHHFYLQLPSIMIDNAGYDTAQLISELRALHTQKKHTMGISKLL